MNVKKICAMMLAAVMTVGMCACGDSKQSSEAMPTEAPVATEAPAVT